MKSSRKYMMYFDHICSVTLSFPQPLVLPQVYLVFPNTPLRFTSYMCVICGCLHVKEIS